MFRLTAWTLRLLKAATYPDWEFMLFIDPIIVERGIRWLLQYQSPNGSFYDGTATLDSKINSIRSDITLTAHVLITLCDCMVSLSGDVKTQAAIAGQRAAAYLERQLTSLADPYHLAITLYALGVGMGQGDLEHGYQALLRSYCQNSDGFIYWSSIEIPANPVKKENQRPFVKPRLYHEDDSRAVETTSWVLLINLHHEGVTERSEKIVQWLNSIRMTAGGFISSVIPKVWGNVLVKAQGAGQAVVQMDVNYGIDHESLVELLTIPSFDLNVTEYYSSHRNKTALTIKSCLRWIREAPEASSATTLEIDTPTGYQLVESVAENIARSGSHPTLRDALVTGRKTFWFFEQVKRDWSCFNYTLRRWYPVGNMSLHRQALLYETTARERFIQVLVNSTPLHVLNICEVCGSYQCPYCPNNNFTALTIPSVFLIKFVLFVQLLNYY